MKKLFILLIFNWWSSYAQSPIVSLLQSGYDDVNGVYYKDTNNQLNPFTGTWKYTNGTTSLTITLQKKVMQKYIDGNYDFFHDILVGEYKYIENGIEKINTIPQLSIQKDPFDYSITGNIFFGPGDKYLRTEFSEDGIDVPGMETSMFFEKIIVNGIQQLKLNFKITEGAILYAGRPLPDTRCTLPYGEYILTKIN